MGNRIKIVGALRALEVAEERQLAGRVAGMLYLTAAATALLLLVIPGATIDSAPTVLVISAIGIVWGIVCLTVVPWKDAPPLVSHLSSGLGLPITVVAMAATGGGESPARFYLLFIIFYASYFYPPREAVPHLIGCALVLALPLAYQPDPVGSGQLAELTVLVPTFFVLGALIIGGKRVMVHLSSHDPLTGLVNRRAFERCLEDSLDGRGSSQAFGLMLCDLDSFKAVNDHHGHPRGDDVLCRTAEALRATVRSGDIVARVGGDEFAIVVEDPGANRMHALAERLRKELERISTELDLDGWSLGASVGWAIYPQDARSRQELIARADDALRTRKSASTTRQPRATVGVHRVELR